MRLKMEPSLSNNDRLNDVFDTSSEKNRNLLFAFLSVQLFILMSAIKTSDVDLFTSSVDFSLPIIGMSVSLVYFYISAPVIMLLLHINLLINVSEHIIILKKWTKNNSNQSLKFPYIVNSMMCVVDEKNKMELFLVRFICILCFVFLPISSIVFLQIRFSFYHSIVISTYHSVVVLMDVFITFKYAGNIFNFNKKKNMYCNKTVNAQLLEYVFFDIKRKLLNMFILLFSGVSIANLAIVAMIIYDVTAIKYISRSVLPILDIHNQYISKLNPVYANTSTPEIIKSTDKRWELYSPLDLSGRHFEMANLANVKLYNANLENTNLQHANMSNIKLSGSWLKNTNLNNAIMYDSDLQHSSFFDTTMQNVNLSRSNLSNSNFTNVYAQGGIFYGAIMPEVNFHVVNFFGASLGGVDFRGANIVFSNMNGSDLTNAKFQGATIDGSYFIAADLTKTDLEGVFLNEVKLYGATLVLAKTDGCFNKDSAVFAADGVQYLLGCKGVLNLGSVLGLAFGISSKGYDYTYYDFLKKYSWWNYLRDSKSLFNYKENKNFKSIQLAYERIEKAEKKSLTYNSVEDFKNEVLAYPPQELNDDHLKNKRLEMFCQNKSIALGLFKQSENSDYEWHDTEKLKSFAHENCIDIYKYIISNYNSDSYTNSNTARLW